MRTLMAGCAAVVFSAVPAIAAQAAPEHQHAAMDKAKPAAGMDAKCKAMMADHEKMMADMKAADDKLDALVTKMNTASATETPAATAIVVTEMAAQRRTMRDGMMKMQEGMMTHMMEHMQAGPASMASCPMMKPMGDKKP
ncbi:MAG: hypothetical protein ABI665_18890 [Vicinamibacterales bacterium]